MKLALNNKILSIVLLSFLFSCSQPNVNETKHPIPTQTPSTQQEQTRPEIQTTLTVTVKDKLMAHYNEWNGVPYRYGGKDKTGIDCSGLVQLTYKKIFSKNLPRTTLTQSSIGSNIERDRLRQGDLVFFKRGRSFRHVGIYLENGYFLHASTSRGVTVSNMSNDYWKRLFWKAKRILDE